MSTPQEAINAFNEINELIAESTVDPIKKARLQKAAAISTAIIQCALAVCADARGAYPPKRIFRAKARAPKKRMDKLMAKGRMWAAPIAARSQVQRILSTPIPDYKSGGIIHEGIPLDNGTFDAISKRTAAVKELIEEMKNRQRDK